MPSYVLKRNLGRTNCLTYVPNNLNVVLSNGRVVIKAGSKIYVPNGFESDGKTQKFDEVVLTSDITSNTGAYSGLYCYNTAGWFSILTNTVSGPSLANPAFLQGWYDTANNIIKRYYNQQGWQTPFSFPICRVTSNGTNITSIDQIFQWCGNFGQTQFFLPGIKGLKSNGFNADGTYKNIEVETKSVLLNGYTYQTTNQQVFIAGNGTSAWRIANYYSQEMEPALTTWSLWHNTKDNFNYYIGADTSTGWVKSSVHDFLAVDNISTNSSYQVTSLTPATVRTAPTIKDCVLRRKTSKDYKDIVTTKDWKEVETTKVEGTPEDYDRVEVESDKSYVFNRIKYHAVPNVTVVGNPTIVDNVASGFSTANYLTLPELFRPENSPWERVICFTTGSDVTNAQMLNYINLASSSMSGAFFSVYASKIYMSLSSNGSSWDIVNDRVGTTTIQPNTTYFVKLRFTGSEYQKLLSMTGEFNGEETLENTVVSSTPIYQANSEKDRLGARVGAQVFTGSIDLSKCYGTINNELWWSGTKFEKY